MEVFPLYYFEILQYFGSYSEMVFLSVIFYYIYSSRMVYIMNNRDIYKWFPIIQALSGCKSFTDIGLNDKQVIKKFINKIELMKKFCDYYVYTLYMMAIIICRTYSSN